MWVPLKKKTLHAQIVFENCCLYIGGEAFHVCVKQFEATTTIKEEKEMRLKLQNYWTVLQE